MTDTQTPVRYGIDLLLSGLRSELAGKSFGLVTNDAATTSAAYYKVTPSRLALQQAELNLVKLFSPEHGLGAADVDGSEVEDSIDSLTGLPVYSLYGDSLRPAPEQLAGLDLLLFDIPDVGARFYTYIWTLSYVMEACAEASLPLWVLDRPNPLSGDLAYAEGPMLDEANISTFVGRWNIPIRHSLTTGELARLWNQEKALGLELSVITLNGWERWQHWPATGNPFVPTSPSLPTYETALVYPGTCLFEGTNLSEGRGTAAPFRQIGAPWLDSGTIVDAFNAHELPGLVARPVQFIPNASKHAGQLCNGVMLHVLKAAQVRPVLAGFYLLADILRLQPQQFEWLAYPTAANQPGHGHFERLVGQLDIRETLTAQPDDLPQRCRRWTQNPNWEERVQPHLLY